MIDISPEDLLKRLGEGKVYAPDRSKQAIANFFREGNLAALREMSLRLTAERVDRQLREYMQRQKISGPWKSGQRLVVAISPSPHSISVIRWARRISYTMDASWIVVYVEQSAKLSENEKEQLAKNMKLARELGAEVVTTADEDIADALMRVAHEQNASQILVGKPNRVIFSRAARLVDNLIKKSEDLDIYIVGQEAEKAASSFRSALHLPMPQSSLVQYVRCRCSCSVDCAFMLSAYAVHGIQNRIVYNSSCGLTSPVENGTWSDTSRGSNRGDSMGFFLHSSSIHICSRKF